MTTTAQLQARYIYAVVRAEDAEEIDGLGLSGLNETATESDRLGDLAVISSRIEPGIIRPQRKLLAAHQRVVAAIAKNHDMLPVSFGLIAEDSAELDNIIRSNADELKIALNRVSGKVEMNLTLRWAVEDIFQFLVAKHAELQSARDQIATGQATRDDMIEIGRSVEAILKRTREENLQKLEDALQDVCAQIDPQDPKSESEIVRLNCLIDRDGEPAFEAAINNVATQYNDDYAFNYNGPWPPYSFVNLKLSAG